MHDGTSVTNIPEEGSSITQVEVNGLRGEYYQAPDDADGNLLQFIDETADIIFKISGNIERDSIFNIAEGVILCK